MAFAIFLRLLKVIKVFQLSIFLSGSVLALIDIYLVLLSISGLDSEMGICCVKLWLTLKDRSNIRCKRILIEMSRTLISIDCFLSIHYISLGQ